MTAGAKEMVYPRVELSESDRRALGHFWNDPDIVRIVDSIREKMRSWQFNNFMSCPDKDELIRLQNQVKAVDIVFGVLAESAKSDEEMKERIRDAKRSIGQVGAPV